MKNILRKYLRSRAVLMLPVAAIMALQAAVLPTEPAAAGPSPALTIDARLFVITADGTETTLPAIQQELDFLGTPYTIWNVSQHPGGLTSGVLANGSHAFYQGVILANSNLSHGSPQAGYHSALTDPEWQALSTYEQAYGIREVDWYSYPTSDNGLGQPTAVDTTTSPINAQFTQAGKSVFPYVNTANALVISNAYTYLAQPLDSTTTPLLVDSQGDALAAVHKYADGRERLLLTFDSNASLKHDLVLAYGLVNWVTRGVFLGMRHSYLAAQPDDLFIDDDIWAGVNVTPGVFRMTGNDLTTLLAWQQNVQAQPNTKNFVLDMPFNGFGTTAGAYTPDTLTPAAKQNQAQFRWLSHTYDHANLDSVTYAKTTSELQKNDTAAQSMGFTNYSKSYMITPDVSGLGNARAMQAAFDFGIRYLVSDTSQPGQNNPTPNTGIVNALQPGILEVPRYPTNLYYNVSQPSEWVSEYNSIYHSYWGRDLTYDEILDKESEILLSYLLKGDIDPLMFHQPNLRAYDGTHSLLGDLLDRTFAKYSALFNLPVLDLTLDKIGQQMASRMQYNTAGVTASIVPGQSITITAQTAATVPVTGLNSMGAEVYGGQFLSNVSLAAGQSLTLPLQNAGPSPYDFSGDGLPDLVLQNSQTNQIAFWFTNGTNLNGSAYALQAGSAITLPAGWQVVGTGDFNGDGKPDLVLNNSGTGQIAFWFTDGVNIVGGAYASNNGGPIAVPGGWQIAAVGDFNGDIKPDLCLQNMSTGQIAFWYMDGTNVTSGAYAAVSRSPYATPTGWQVVGAADFNGDGKTDLVLDNSATGQIVFWYLDGGSITGGAYITSGGAPAAVPAGWQIVGVGDYNGDGNPDLVLQNTGTGGIAFWYTAGSNISSGAYLVSGGAPMLAPAGWGVAGPR